MSEAGEPEWFLLPEHPVRFFRLQPSFTLQDLKRAYGILIRRYRPEKSPAEFKRIRRAFELIESQLKYGMLGWQPAFDGDDQSSTSAPDSRRIDRDDAPIQNVDSVPPESRSSGTLLPLPPPEGTLDEIGAWIAGLDQQTARADFLRAIQAEAQSGKKDELTFWRAILDAMERYPFESAFHRLAFACASLLPADELMEPVLRLLADRWKGDDFYYLTVAMWDRLLEARPFDATSRMFEDVEEKRKDARDHARATFMIPFLKRSVWKADEVWMNAQIDTLNDLRSSLSDWEDAQLESITILLDYRKRRDVLLSFGAPLQRLDNLICAHASGYARDLPQKFRAFQRTLEGNESTLLRAFGRAHDKNENLYALIDQISMAAGMKWEMPTGTPDRVSRTMLLPFCHAMEALAQRSWAGFKWHFFRAVLAFAGIGGVIGVVILFFVFTYQFMLVMPEGYGFAAFFVALGTCWLMVDRFFKKLWFPKLRTAMNGMEDRLARNAYEDSWRECASRFMARHRMTSFQLGFFVRQLVKPESFLTWFCKFLETDMALHIQSLAYTLPREQIRRESSTLPLWIPNPEWDENFPDEIEDLPQEPAVSRAVETEVESPKPAIKAEHRFVARMMDWGIFDLALTFLQSVAPWLFADSVSIRLLLGPLLWCFIEPIFLKRWGATPGKWCMRIRVVAPAGGTISYRDGLRRSISVWFFGYGCGLFIISLVALLNAYDQYNKNGITRWDSRKSALRIEPTPDSKGQEWLAWAIFFLPFFRMVYAFQLELDPAAELGYFMIAVYLAIYLALFRIKREIVARV